MTSPKRAGKRITSCEWTVNNGDFDDYWDTDCGHAFVFTDDGPLENGFLFCCYCGKPIKIPARRTRK